MTPSERPSFKELYEAQTKKMDEIEKRISRIEKGFVFLIVLVASPKAGGPEASKVIAEAIKTYIAMIT